MSRAAIISGLLACLEAMGPDSGDYIAAARVVRGIRLASEMPERPALCLFNERVETSETGPGQVQRELVLHLWGAADVPDGNYAELDALAASCLAALADPALNPYRAQTSCGDLHIYEGGASDPVGLFDMELRVAYESALATL